MNEHKETSDECQMQETDAEGHTNLCCCGVLDEADIGASPCYTPADDCCCC